MKRKRAFHEFCENILVDSKAKKCLEIKLNETKIFDKKRKSKTKNNKPLCHLVYGDVWRSLLAHSLRVGTGSNYFQPQSSQHYAAPPFFMPFPSGFPAQGYGLLPQSPFGSVPVIDTPSIPQQNVAAPQLDTSTTATLPPATTQQSSSLAADSSDSDDDTSVKSGSSSDANPPKHNTSRYLP